MTSSLCEGGQRALVFLPLCRRMLIPLLVQPSWSHLNIITFQSSPTLGVRTLIYEFRGDTNVQSTTHHSRSSSLKPSSLFTITVWVLKNGNFLKWLLFYNFIFLFIFFSMKKRVFQRSCSAKPANLLEDFEANFSELCCVGVPHDTGNHILLVLLFIKVIWNLSHISESVGR